MHLWVPPPPLWVTSFILFFLQSVVVFSYQISEDIAESGALVYLVLIQSYLTASECDIAPHTGSGLCRGWSQGTTVAETFTQQRPETT